MAIDILAAFENEPEPLDYVLPNMLAGTVGALVSPGGTGKSMLALQIATTLAGASDLLELGDIDTGPVAYLPAEDPPIAVRHRLHAIGQHLDSDSREIVAERLLIEPLIAHTPDLLDPEWLEAVTRVATERRLLVLDTLRRFHLADENDSGAMARLVSQMEAIAARTGCAIVFLHHASKSAALGGQGDQQQASRGSSVLVDNVRWQAFLAGMSVDDAKAFKVEDSERRKYVRFGISKANYGAPEADRWYRRHEGGVLRPEVMKQNKQEQSNTGGKEARKASTDRGDWDDW